MSAPPSELLALRCDGCKARVPIAGTAAATGVTSAHEGKPHNGCPAKAGTWRGERQLTLLEVPRDVAHG